MISSPKQRIGPLLSLSAVLAGVLALEVMAGPFFVPEAPAVSPGAKNSVDFPRESPAEKPAISTFAEVVERPLFTPSRRPPPPKTDSTIAASSPKPETFDLIGVIISADRRMALSADGGLERGDAGGRRSKYWRLGGACHQAYTSSFATRE